jgi:uncharacterized protein YqgC (DUF456 family)
MEMTALILAIILFIVGLIGTVLPFLPGAILVYGGMLLYGFLTGFTTLSLYFFIFQAIALGIILLVDYLASAVGTKRFGGSKQAAWGAIIGTILGIFFGPLGIIIGPFLGAFAAEMLSGTSMNQALLVGLGTIIGFLGGTVLKIGIEILMIVYFFLRIFPL